MLTPKYILADIPSILNYHIYTVVLTFITDADARKWIYQLEYGYIIGKDIERVV